MPPETQNVYQTYNIISDWFHANRDQSLMEKSYLVRVLEKIGPQATVLDLGCGTGLPMMAYLNENGVEVLGVDASEKMLEIARLNLPDAEFVLSDMRNLKLDRRFDAIIAWHSFFHLPAADQPDMFRIFSNHLNPGGLLLFTSGKEKGEAWGMNGGENLYHASLDRVTYEYLLRRNGFEALDYVEDDPDCGFATVWLAVLK